MNTTLDEIIARKKLKELEAAKIAEKLAKAKRYKELKRRQKNVVNSVPLASESSDCTPQPTASSVISSQATSSGKENETPVETSNTLAGAKVSPIVSKRGKDSQTESRLLGKAGALVRDSQDPHTPIWVPGLSYPAQYCIRQTRSLSQKLQVDDVDCIDLADCMFGSQRMKMKVEGQKSGNGSSTPEVSAKLLRRKKGRKGRRRRKSSKLSQGSRYTDSSDCGIEFLSDQPVVFVDSDNNRRTIKQSSPGGDGNNSVSLAQQLADVNDVDVAVPLTQQLIGGDHDTDLSFKAEGDCHMAEILTPEYNDADDMIPSGQQHKCNDISVELIQQCTGDSDNTIATMSQQLAEGHGDMDTHDDYPMQDSGQQQSIENADSTTYGLTESMLLSMEVSCDAHLCVKSVIESTDQISSDTCTFWCEQGENLNSKVTLCKDSNSSSLQCNVILKHTISGTAAPLLRVSNIASSTSDGIYNVYIAVQLSSYIAVWHCSSEWKLLGHWPFVVDQISLMCFSVISLTGGVAVCTITTTGMWRVSFVEAPLTKSTHCVCNRCPCSDVVCCWSNSCEVLMAVATGNGDIVVQAVRSFSNKVRKEIRLPFSGEVCSLCGVENSCTASGEGAWLLAATPTGIAVLDVENECLLQNVSLTCSNVTDDLQPKCLRVIREDCYTFIVLGYEYNKKGIDCKVVGWLVAIDNSEDTSTALPTHNSPKTSLAKLLREYQLPLTFSDSGGYLNYSCASCDDQLVVTTPTPSLRLCSWNQFTGAVTSCWTISTDQGIKDDMIVQCNFSMLAVSSKEEQGNLYIYELNK